MPLKPPMPPAPQAPPAAPTLPPPDGGTPPPRELAAAPPLLEIIGLSVRRERETLLEAVSFTVRPGTIHVVIGPNGAGKSTLLLALLGQTAFTGRVVANWRGDGRIGFVPQTFAVDRTLPVTVADFLALSRQRRPVCLGIGAAARRRIADLLARVGLAGTEDRPLAVLSGGELRRVLLANAIDPLPELLVLDEPASGLDEAAVERLGEILLALRRNAGLTVVMVSHDLRQVTRLADRVTVLNRRLLFDGPPDQALAASPADPANPANPADPASSASPAKWQLGMDLPPPPTSPAPRAGRTG